MFIHKEVFKLTNIHYRMPLAKREKITVIFPSLIIMFMVGRQCLNHRGGQNSPARSPALLSCHHSAAVTRTLWISTAQYAIAFIFCT